MGLLSVAIWLPIVLGILLGLVMPEARPDYPPPATPLLSADAHGDPAYYAARPTIAIPKTSLLNADSFFGFHPELAPLMPLWNSGSLATVHATGLPSPNRSHFAAMEELEDADPGSSGRTGWLNRLLGTTATTSPLEGVAIGTLVPTSLVGPEPVLSMPSLEQSDRKSTRLNSSHVSESRMPSSA